MNTTAGNTATHCAHCGRPCLAAVWVGSLPYHEECTRGPGHQWPIYAANPLPHPGWSGAVPVLPMREEDVRRIVREELAARDKPQNVELSGHQRPAQEQR